MERDGKAAAEIRRVRRIWDRSAPKYDKSMRFWERTFFKGGREWVASQVGGDVLEVAVGTGRNLDFYPAGTRLTGIDLSAGMLGDAAPRAARRGFRLLLGDALRLPFAGASFDTVVFSLCLCSIPDDVAAVAEARRVLRPGGRVVAFEHVAAPSRGIRMLQELVGLVTRPLYGDHPTREPEKVLAAAGFAVETNSRSAAGIVQRLVARKPA